MRKDTVTPLDEARITFLRCLYRGGALLYLDPDQYENWERLGMSRTDMDRLLNTMVGGGEAVFTNAKFSVAVRIAGAGE